MDSSEQPKRRGLRRLTRRDWALVGLVITFEAVRELLLPPNHLPEFVKEMLVMVAAVLVLTAWEMISERMKKRKTAD